MALSGRRRRSAPPATNWPVGEIARALGVALHVKGDVHWYELADEASGLPLRLELDARHRAIRLCVDAILRDPPRRAGDCRTELVALPRMTAAGIRPGPGVVRFRSAAEPRTEFEVSARGSWRTALAPHHASKPQEDVDEPLAAVASCPAVAQRRR
jgi:hypothetical protein